MPALPLHNRRLSALLLATVLSTACGGGGGGDSGSSVSAANPTALTTPTSTDSSTTLATRNAAVTAVDTISTQEQAAIDYISMRREQLGLPRLTYNAPLRQAAAAHTRYTLFNDQPGHDETPGKTGFTGANLADRLVAANYDYKAATEVFSRSSDESAALAVESLLAAIYHRFAMFRSDLAEAGAGAARASGDREVPVVDLTVNLGATTANQPPAPTTGSLYAYPFDGQTDAPLDFLSDAELPDPVPNVNRVGYPISVQSDPRSKLTVTSFTVKPLDGAGAGVPLSTHMLRHATDSDTPEWAASIIPLAPLSPASRYEVSFQGKVDGTTVSRTWTFRTQSVQAVSVSYNVAQISTSQAAVFTISGGLGAALEKVTYVRSGDVTTAPIDIRLLSNTQFSLTANGQCPNSCSATAIVKDRDGRQASATITVLR